MGRLGELLHNARVYRGATLLDAERATRINRRYLAALEQEAFEALPPLPYARGIVRVYAQYLGLDPVTVLALFEEAYGQRNIPLQLQPATRSTPREPFLHWAPNFAVIAFMVALSAIVFTLVFATYFSPRSPSDARLTGATPLAQATSSDLAIPTSGVSPTTTLNTVTVPMSTPQVLAPETTPTPIETPPLHTTAPNPAGHPTPSPKAATREHLFEIVATDRVWVQATLDGEVVLAEVLGPAARRTFRGRRLTVTSGNAPLVRIIVDGEDRGPLGQRWDDTASYP